MTQFSPTFNFYQIKPAIFLLEIDGNNDLAYTFLRVQEFYESVNDDIRGQNFTFEQYKSWYSSQSKDGTFSYGNDWKGFNVPSQVIEQCYAINHEHNVYDEFFLNICQKASHLAAQAGCDNYYILGVRKGDTTTLEHEIAHGLFTTNSEYRQIMTESVQQIPHDIINPLFINLSNMGYGPNVYIDEAQAYLSTGLKDSQKSEPLIEFSYKFSSIFKKFLHNWSLPAPLIKNIT